MGDLIRALRWRKRLSPEQLAERLGVHRITVTRWETARVVPNAETRLRLCATLDTFPAERAVLLASPDAPPLWDVVTSNLDACREETARLEYNCLEQVDPLFDLRAHLLAGTLYNLAARQPLAYPILTHTYAIHAHFACLRGDDTAALDYSERSLDLIRQDAAPSEAALYWALWASGHSLTHRMPHSGPQHSLLQITRWLPKVQTPDMRAFLFLNAAWWALQAGLLRESRDYWQKGNALGSRSLCANSRFHLSLQSVYASLLVREGRYDAALEVGLQIESNLYQRQIMRQLFQTNVFLKAGDKSEADTHLRRAYDLIAIYQADLYRKQADQFAVQLERLA